MRSEHSHGSDLRPSSNHSCPRPILKDMDPMEECGSFIKNARRKAGSLANCLTGRLALAGCLSGVGGKGGDEKGSEKESLSEKDSLENKMLPHTRSVFFSYGEV